jgi:short-subunit dehydrogenase
MAVKLKKLSDQVIVITGATSGIGLTTARHAAAKGAKLVLIARDHAALDTLVAELRGHGSEAIAAPADVGNPEQVASAAESAIAAFGRIDTWINNAGVSIYGRLEEVPLEDMHRLFQTNFWGVVHGSLQAARHLRPGGGALINVGSEVSDHGLPLQGIYGASKHAVKGFTDALRMELENAGAPISVTLIKPAGIDTMFTAHAKNYMDVEPTLPPPVYAPDLVANAILYAAEHAVRDQFVGGAAKLNSAGAHHMPRAFDKFSEKAMFGMQRTDRPTAPDRQDGLYKPVAKYELRERLGHDGHVAEISPYTAATMRARPLTLALLGGGALWATWKYATRNSRVMR